MEALVFVRLQDRVGACLRTALIARVLGGPGGGKVNSGVRWDGNDWRVIAEAGWGVEKRKVRGGGCRTGGTALGRAIQSALAASV